MKTWMTVSVAALAGVAASASAGMNLLTNAGFEDPLTFDGPPFVGFWEAFAGGPNSSTFNSMASPRNGAQHAQLQILGDDNSFTGLFQDVAVAAGQEITFSGYHATPSSALDVGIEYRIEWRNAAGNFEVSRTGNVTIAPGSSTYELFSLTAIVPVGADLARVVYAIQTFGGDGPTNNGVIYLDDLSVTVIPAPAAASLLGLAGLAATRRRR